MFAVSYQIVTLNESWAPLKKELTPEKGSRRHCGALLYVFRTDNTAVVQDASYLWALCRRPGTVCRRRAMRSDSWTGPLRPTRWRRRRLSSRPTTTSAACVSWPADKSSRRSVVADRRQKSSDRQRLTAVNGRCTQWN